MLEDINKKVLLVPLVFSPCEPALICSAEDDIGLSSFIFPLLRPANDTICVVVDIRK